MVDFSYSSNFEKRDIEMARLFMAFKLFWDTAEIIPPVAAVGASLTKPVIAVVGRKRAASFALPGITLKVAADFAPDIILLIPRVLAPGAAEGGGLPCIFLNKFLVL